MKTLFLEPPDLTPTKPLMELFKLTKLHASENASFEHLFDLSQKHFLRKKGVERELLKDPLSYRFRRKAFLKLFNELGLVQKINPPKREYQGTVILGSVFHEFLMRISFALSFSLKTDQYVFLGSERLLSNKEKREIKKMFGKHHLETEIDMMKFVIDELLPDYIDSECIVSSNRGKLRATTRDTLIDFFSVSNRSGSYLLVSSQPFAYYQYLSAQKLAHELNKSTNFDISAPESSHQPVKVYLDVIARILYELHRHP